MLNSTISRLGGHVARILSVVVPLALAGLVHPLVSAEAAPGSAFQTLKPAASASKANLDSPTDTGSATWQRQAPIPTGATLFSVDMISATEGWAAGDHAPMEAIDDQPSGTILHTTDGGRT